MPKYLTAFVLLFFTSFLCQAELRAITLSEQRINLKIPAAFMIAAQGEKPSPEAGSHLTQTPLQEQEQKNNRRLTYLGFIILLMLIIMVLALYLIKQRSNRKLLEQKEEIDQQKQQLETVLRQKEELLEAREWLLKEVHHRVKNNLQIIMSLLNSQTSYLKDDAALSAVLESQNRVQAMSLIHQKLYKSNNVSTVYMPEYIRDLTDHLKESFKTGLSIYFKFEIDPVWLDISQAIPVGLILNEAITNSIKYAFKGTVEPVISIGLTAKDAGMISLVIGDNGGGMPPLFDITNVKSFGMALINGLTGDLHGDFELQTEEGTVVRIRFRAADIVSR